MPSKIEVEELVKQIFDKKEIKKFLLDYLSVNEHTIKCINRLSTQYQHELVNDLLKPYLVNPDKVRIVKALNASYTFDLTQLLWLEHQPLANIIETLITQNILLPLSVEYKKISAREPRPDAPTPRAAATAEPRPSLKRAAPPAAATDTQSMPRPTRTSPKATATQAAINIPPMTRSRSKMAEAAEADSHLSEAMLLEIAKIVAQSATAKRTLPPLTRSASQEKTDQIVGQLKKYRDIIIAGLVRSELIPERLAHQKSKLTTAACVDQIKKFDMHFTVAAKQGLELSRQDVECERIKDEFFLALMGFARPKPPGLPSLARQDTGIPVSSLFFRERDDSRKRTVDDPAPEEKNIRIFLKKYPHILEFLCVEMPKIKIVAQTYYQAEQTFIQDLMIKTGAAPHYKPAPNPFTPEEDHTDTETDDDDEEASAEPAAKAPRANP